MPIAEPISLLPTIPSVDAAADLIPIVDISTGITSNVTPANLGTPGATTINITDESSDTTTFPIFVNTATGVQALHSNTSLTFNAATGALGASFFGGIASANLVDKSAVETISGVWTFSAQITAGIKVLDNDLITLGTSNDTLIKFDTTNLIIRGGSGIDVKFELFDSYDFDGIITATGQAVLGGVKLSDNDLLTIGTSNDTLIKFDATNLIIRGGISIDLLFETFDNYKFDDSIFIAESTTANADAVGLGQWWVRSDSPNTPMFTDDAGTDFELNATAGTNITVANEATDTTTFPVFTTAATGSLPPKTNAGLTFNSATSDLSATLIAGIANANLVDKSATESVSGTWTFTAAVNLNAGGNLLDNAGFSFGTGNDVNVKFDATDFEIRGGAFDLNFLDFNNYKFDDSIFITEKAAANADVSALGQWWVRADVPNTPMFTDDAGTDFVLNAAGGTTITVADESTDVSSFPVFVTAATGALGPKTNTGLTFNAATSDLSATLIAGIANANLLDKSAAETVSGVWTFSSQILGGIKLVDNDLITLGTGNDTLIKFDATDLIIRGGSGIDLLFETFDGYKFDDSIYITEKAATSPSSAGLGQFWVRDDAPNTPMFTNDNGVDFVIDTTAA